MIRILKGARRAYRSSRGLAAGQVARRRQRAALAALRDFRQPYRLNLGCGDVLLDGWVNIDLDDPTGKADLRWDLTRGIPIETSTCEFVYCEHLLEHLAVAQGVAFLRECRRVLRPDGVLRIAMPSLDVLIQKSCCGDWRDQDWLTWPGTRFIQTRAEMLNIAFRWWGHQWLYDGEELERRLREAGWEALTPARHGESDFPDLRSLETRADSLLIYEARKER